METEQLPPPSQPPTASSNEEYESVSRALSERIERHDDSRRAVQDKLHGLCEGLRKQIDEFEDGINTELEKVFTAEDSRLQAILSDLNSSTSANDESFKRAKAELLVFQSYELAECSPGGEESEKKKRKVESGGQEPRIDFVSLYKLKTERHFVPEMLELRKPTDVRIVKAGVNSSIQFTHLRADELEIISSCGVEDQIRFTCFVAKKDSEGTEGREYPLKKAGGWGCFAFTLCALEPMATYTAKVKVAFRDDESEWSDEVEFTTAGFTKCCGWRECPDDIDKSRRYLVFKKNPRAVSMKGNCTYCTIPGNAPLPPGTVTSWGVKVLKSKNCGFGTYVGVAPFGIDQKEINYYRCGWYLDCYNSVLCSGPPHNYKGKEYGPRKESGGYVRVGDTVDVVMNTAKGEVSFGLNGADFGIAFDGIPLDKPLVPCVILYRFGDSIELII